MEMPFIEEAEKVSKELQIAKANLQALKKDHNSLQQKLYNAHQARLDDWKAFQNSCIGLAKSHHNILEMQTKLKDLQLKQMNQLRQNQNSNKLADTISVTRESACHKESLINKPSNSLSSILKSSLNSSRLEPKLASNMKKSFNFSQKSKVGQSPMNILQQYKSFNTEAVKSCHPVAGECFCPVNDFRN